MTSSATVRLHIGSALPPGNEEKTRDILALWQQVGNYFKERSFAARHSFGSEPRTYQITLDASRFLENLESAHAQSGSFARHRQSYIDGGEVAVGGEMMITIARANNTLSEEESYQVTTAFVQQLVMATHISCPGAFHLLDTRFVGKGAHRYEAQEFDARIFHGALRAASENLWPKLDKPSFESVWNWLEASEVSQTDIAIADIIKVLFTLLKVAQQRHEYSARTVLLVMYQLEVLLDCRQFNSLDIVRSRLRLILGNIPEAADCLQELHEVRHQLFMASHPVNPPPLICHTTETALREQLGQHNSAVEKGTALVLKLLQDLIAHNAYRYEFTESFTRS